MNLTEMTYVEALKEWRDTLEAAKTNKAAFTKFRRIQYRLPISAWDKIAKTYKDIFRDITAYACGGLIIHRSLDPQYSKQFTITHRESGRGLFFIHTETLWQAAEIAEKLLTVPIWNLPYSELEIICEDAHHEYNRAIIKIVNPYINPMGRAPEYEEQPCR